MSVDKIANWLIIVTSVVMLPLAVLRIYEMRQPSFRIPTTESLFYAKGDRFSPSQRIRFGDANRAIVAIINSNCVYCTQSMEFYRKLADMARQLPQLEMVVVGPENSSTLQAYVSAHGVQPVQVLSVRSEDLRIRGTPTLLSVARDGTIEEVWSGLLKPQREEVVITFMNGEMNDRRDEP